MLNHLKKTYDRALTFATHRVLYSGLTVGHLNGCFLTDYPQLYAPLTLFYALLALKG